MCFGEKCKQGTVFRLSPSFYHDNKHFSFFSHGWLFWSWGLGKRVFILQLTFSEELVQLVFIVSLIIIVH